MHVGHIRSTILGDSLARTLRLLGHRVITDNHIGDWGTQFGMLLLGWKHHLKPDALKADPIGEMERLYKMVSATGEAMETVRDAARQELVKLQGGDAENLKIWHEMIALSQKQFDTIYCAARREIRPHARRKLLQSAAQTAGGRTARQGHRARKRRRDCHFLRRRAPAQGTARAHPQERRRVQLHHHGPGHAGVPAGNLAAG